MNPDFVRCEYCKAMVSNETCKLAGYKAEIDGKPYTFCCKQCAKRYEQKQKKTEKASK